MLSSLELHEPLVLEVLFTELKFKCPILYRKYSRAQLGLEEKNRQKRRVRRLCLHIALWYIGTKNSRYVMCLAYDLFFIMTRSVEPSLNLPRGRERDCHSVMVNTHVQ